MHLAHGEGVELEGQLGRRIGIWLLHARQLDIESDRRRADFAGPAIKKPALNKDNLVVHRCGGAAWLSHFVVLFR
jgi:hypothetical protein